ncbi:hypothetical protein CROQUDRAFT_101749 [Cronartium quercuum f. sp. fusiforme G11]|uniref:Uncharacterized protein n=1 Tax=Cronartium quercuum f. sp. fusiforme G11 TaxID=708437 RepID=A0A9P6N8I6_9BASI|nr:hypothetical protein CROQUDRAFT_101749 [Cronartium quercuum f. sp. fusiforme G11]
MSNRATTYKAFNYTKPASLGEIAPIYRADKTLTMDKMEQAALLFAGTSIMHVSADLSEPRPTPMPLIPQEILHNARGELEDILQQLLRGKAKGSDAIPNKLIQLASNHIIEPLCHLLNACLRLTYFPLAWRMATTAIIRKFDKDDYSAANSY